MMFRNLGRYLVKRGIVVIIKRRGQLRPNDKWCGQRIRDQRQLLFCLSLNRASPFSCGVDVWLDY